MITPPQRITPIINESLSASFLNTDNSLFFPDINLISRWMRSTYDYVYKPTIPTGQDCISLNLYAYIYEFNICNSEDGLNLTRGTSTKVKLAENRYFKESKILIDVDNDGDEDLITFAMTNRLKLHLLSCSKVNLVKSHTII